MRHLPVGTFGRLQDGRPYSWTPVNKGLKGLNCDTDFVKYQHNKGWRLTQVREPNLACLLSQPLGPPSLSRTMRCLAVHPTPTPPQVGEDQARQYCHRDNLPLPQWAGGQGVGSTQPQRTGVGTPQQARGRSSMQASAQELRRLPASAAAAQAAMRRQVQAAAGAVAGQQPAVLATTAGGSIRPRLAGTKREGRGAGAPRGSQAWGSCLARLFWRVSSGWVPHINSRPICRPHATEPDVVDLYGGREGGAPPAQRARQGEPGGSGAGGSVERLGSQARELAEMLGVPQSAAEAALIASHGDRNAAAGLLLDAAQPAMAQQQQQPQGGVLRAGRRADPATEWPLRGRLALPPLEPGEQFGSTYDVVLLLDANEQQGRLPALVNALQARGVVAETRRLPVGDALWVARPR